MEDALENRRLGEIRCGANRTSNCRDEKGTYLPPSLPG